jgi:hypothetical protein
MVTTQVSQTNIFAALYRPLEKVLLLRKDAVYLLLTERKLFISKCFAATQSLKYLKGLSPNVSNLSTDNSYLSQIGRMNVCNIQEAMWKKAFFPASVPCRGTCPEI